jgi:hypothetical protein
LPNADGDKEKNMGNGAKYTLATLKEGEYSGRIFTVDTRSGNGDVELTFLFGKERGMKLGKYPKEDVVMLKDF